VGPTSQMRVGSWIVLVIQCFGVISLLRGVDPGGVDLRGVDLPKVWTSLLINHSLIVPFALLHA
jgi:hypothetical protein